MKALITPGWFTPDQPRKVQPEGQLDLKLEVPLGRYWHVDPFTRTPCAHETTITLEIRSRK